MIIEVSGCTSTINDQQGPIKLAQFVNKRYKGVKDSFGE